MDLLDLALRNRSLDFWLLQWQISTSRLWNHEVLTRVIIIRAKSKQSVVRDWVRFRSAWLGNNGRNFLSLFHPTQFTLHSNLAPRCALFENDRERVSSKEGLWKQMCLHIQKFLIHRVETNGSIRFYFLQTILIPQKPLHRLFTGTIRKATKNTKVCSRHFFLNLEPSLRPKNFRMLITFFRSKRPDGLGNDNTSQTVTQLFFPF